MQRLVIESPYAGNVEQNVQFARDVCKYAVYNGYAPIASHLLYPQFLDDNKPNERTKGIDAGLTWAQAADDVWFCLLAGVHKELSKGMEAALKFYDGVDYCFILFKKRPDSGILYPKECYSRAQLEEAAREAMPQV